MTNIVHRIRNKMNDSVRSSIRRQMARLDRCGAEPTWQIFVRTPAWEVVRETLTIYTEECFREMWAEEEERIMRSRLPKREYQSAARQGAL